MSPARVTAAGVVTGWGSGIAALPDDATAAAGGRAIVSVPSVPAASERFRRATRECLLGVAAVEALQADAALDRATLAGPRTGFVYVTAAAYGASNRLFLEGAGGRALHFPYTAPCAVAAEVSIEFRLTGPYVTMVGGADTTRDALWHAGRLLDADACDRVLVLALETFAECADLWARARWRCPAPLTEAAACVMLEPDGHGWAVDPTVLGHFERLARRRAGETLACGPVIALALARAAAVAEPLTATTGD